MSYIQEHINWMDKMIEEMKEMKQKWIDELDGSDIHRDVNGEKGIDYCPYCEGDLIRNVGNSYGCNECGNNWDITEETFCENCGIKIFNKKATDMDFCNQCIVLYKEQTPQPHTKVEETEGDKNETK